MVPVPVTGENDYVIGCQRAERHVVIGQYDRGLTANQRDDRPVLLK